MIQPIGKNPVSAPRATARSAMPVGIVKRRWRSRSATSSDHDGRDVNLELSGGDQREQEDRGNRGHKVEMMEFPNGS
jgi:hypothetical protein